MSANFKRTALSLAVLSVFSVVAHSADIDASQDNITYQVTQGETIGSVTVSGGHSASIAGDEINITGAIKVTTSGQPDSTSSSLTIGTNTTESVKISVETGNAFNTNGSKLDIYGQEIHIQTASDNASAAMAKQILATQKQNSLKFRRRIWCFCFTLQK